MHEHEAPLLSELSAEQRKALVPALLDPIEYRKSGLSLNHVIGCPLDCAYCVRHLFQNFAMKQPRLLMPDAEAVEQLVGHRYFQRGRTPIQIFNRATDPFLPVVKGHTFRVLRLLADRGLTNHVLLITRFVVTPEDAERLNEFAPLKLSLLVTYSGIDDRRIEPIGWRAAADSLQLAFRSARDYRVILYWRPLIEGTNDSEDHIERAARLSLSAHATAFTGLFFRDVIQTHYRAQGLPLPYEETARRKILPRSLEATVLAAFKAKGAGPIFRKTSCAIAFAHREADYNGHFCIREICDICPEAQVARCAAAHKRPTPDEVQRFAVLAGATSVPEISDRAIAFDGLSEQPRYFIQHALGYQVHDRRHPHLPNRHGRAEVGWRETDDED